ncbi:MAG: hypothetical protein OXN27_09650 [Candidatus Poribacteria bacterium]|nr:hypothetical protein [Candidatus Poribacteria bacterium]
MNNSNTFTPQPMRFAEILDTTFSLYRKHFLLFLGIIVLYFCGILGKYLFERFLPEFSGKNFVADLIDMPFTLISMGGIIVAMATIYLSGRITTSRNALKQARHRFWHVLVCAFVWSLAFDISRIGVVFPMSSVINPITRWTPGSSVDTDPLIHFSYMLAFLRLVSMPFSIYLQTPLWHIISFLLFFVMKPGLLWIQLILFAFVPFSIYYAVRWTFATPVVLLEESPIRRAFKRSSGLTRGNWWRVWGMLISFSVLTFAVQRILESTVGFILILTRLAGAVSPMDIFRWAVMYTSIDADPLFYTIMMWAGFIVRTLIFPIWVIGITLLYFDLRIRKEGFNGEMPLNNTTN